MNPDRFPAHRDLAGFEFANSTVDETLMHSLYPTTFTEAAHNVVLISGPSTGKTHLTTAFGVEAIQRLGKRVHFHDTTELANTSEAETASGRVGQLAHRLMYVVLLILDELGYRPFS